MVEYSTRNLSHGRKLTEQQLLRSFQSAVEKAISTGIKFDTKIVIDNWELIFSPATSDKTRYIFTLIMKGANYESQKL